MIKINFFLPILSGLLKKLWYSEISERLFSGQFTRWTLQLEIQDAFIYDVPYRRNWKLFIDEQHLLDPAEYSALEVVEDLNKFDPQTDLREALDFQFKKN